MIRRSNWGRDAMNVLIFCEERLVRRHPKTQRYTDITWKCWKEGSFLQDSQGKAKVHLLGFVPLRWRTLQKIFHDMVMAINDGIPFQERNH